MHQKLLTNTAINQFKTTEMIEVCAQNSGDIWFSIALNQHQVIASSFGANQTIAIKNVLANLSFNSPFQVFHQPTPYAKGALETLRNIYEGKKTTPNFQLATKHLPAYTKKVLRTTSAIPLGYITSYGAIANAVGGGPRAVGNVMASNPFPLIVPCHRVVRSNFTLGGYGFGLKTKIELLGKEKQGFSSSLEVNVEGGRLTVFPIERLTRHFAYGSGRK